MNCASKKDYYSGTKYMYAKLFSNNRSSDCLRFVLTTRFCDAHVNSEKQQQ